MIMGNLTRGGSGVLCSALFGRGHFEDVRGLVELAMVPDCVTGRGFFAPAKLHDGFNGTVAVVGVEGIVEDGVLIVATPLIVAKLTDRISALRNPERLGTAYARDGAARVEISRNFRKGCLRVEVNSGWIDVHADAVNILQPVGGALLFGVRPMEQLQREFLVHDAALNLLHPSYIHRVVSNEASADDLRLTFEDPLVQIVERFRQSTHSVQTFTVLNKYGMIPIRLLVNHQTAFNEREITIESEPVDLVEQFERMNPNLPGSEFSKEPPQVGLCFLQVQFGKAIAGPGRLSRGFTAGPPLRTRRVELGPSLFDHHQHLDVELVAVLQESEQVLVHICRIDEAESNPATTRLLHRIEMLQLGGQLAAIVPHQLLLTCSKLICVLSIGNDTVRGCDLRD